MDNTIIADRLKAIEESLRLQKKVFNKLTFIDILDCLRVLFTSLPLLEKYLATPLLEKLFFSIKMKLIFGSYQIKMNQQFQMQKLGLIINKTSINLI